MRGNWKHLPNKRPPSQTCLHAILLFGKLSTELVAISKPKLGQKNVQTNFKRSFERVKTAAAQKSGSCECIFFKKNSFCVHTSVGKPRLFDSLSFYVERRFFVPRQNPYWVSLSARLPFSRVREEGVWVCV